MKVKAFTSDMFTRMSILAAQLMLTGKALRLPTSNVSFWVHSVFDLSPEQLEDLKSKVDIVLSKLTRSTNKWIEGSTRNEESEFYTDWSELLDLLMGYKINRKVSEERAAEIERLEKEIAAAEKRAMSPAERAAALKEKLEALKG